MPLFKVSVESVVPVSAVVFSSAVLKEDAIAEVRLLQARARVNWRRANTPIGAIDAPYDIWALPAAGGWNVSLSAKITVSSSQSVIAEDSPTVDAAVVERQSQGLIKWLYRGVPIGEYKESIPTAWSNQQPDQITATTFVPVPIIAYPGQSIVMTSDVSGADTPAGNLEFRDVAPGGLGTLVSTTLEADPVVVGLAHATAVVTLPTGAYTIGASYLGSDGFQPSNSSTLTVSISKVETTTLVSSPSSPIYAGQQVSVFIEVTQNPIVPTPPVPPPLPTGTVTLFQGSTLVAASILSIVDGSSVASFSLGSLVPGSYDFTVQYDGDAVNVGSSGDISGIEVLKVPTIANVTVLMAATDEPIISAVFSQPVRIRASVNSLVSGTIPTGVVEFWDGSTLLGTANLTPLQFTAQADFPYNGFSVGTHSTIHVVYLGNDSFDGFFSSNWSLNVVQAQSVVSAFSQNTPTKSGQAALFDATVGVLPPATLTPFQVYGVAGQVIYTDPTVSFVNFNGSGHAPKSNSVLPVGFTGVIVSFPASAEYLGSNTFFTHTVEKASTTASISISPNQNLHYYDIASVSSTVSVTAPGTTAAGAVSGTVGFTVHDNFFGTLFLGSANVVGGVATLPVPYGYLIYAYYFNFYITGTVQASYSGDSRYNASLSGFLAYTVAPV